MRVAGRLASEVLDMIDEHVVSGVTTDELNKICHDYIVQQQDAIPAPLNYRGFPKSICTSVNHVICHGIPGEKRLKKGDIINIDVTVIKDGYHGDNSRMYYVGKPSIMAKRLCDIARESMFLGIEMVKPGVQLTTQKLIIFLLYENIVATELVKFFMKNHRFYIMAAPVLAWY